MEEQTPEIKNLDFRSLLYSAILCGLKEFIP